MSSKPIAVHALSLTKQYVVFERASDRLLQLLWPRKGRAGRVFTALKDVSFSLQQGQVLGVVGNNGAGKSTLLQLICQTLTPTRGQLSVNGRVAALLELGAGFNPEFTGRENVFLNAAVLGLSQAEIHARFDEIVAFSGIGEFIDQPVKTYSSGMYVRLAFAIATSVDPDILVIDEALSVGDGAFARKSFDRIMALRDKGATILFCSHSMYHIEAISDQALWLENGSVRMLDTPDVVTRAYAASLTEEGRGQSEGGGLALVGGRARLLDVVISTGNQSGKKLDLVSGESDVQMLVTFEFDSQLPVPSVAFGIDTASGVTVTSGSTAFDGFVPIVTEPGRASVELCLPRIPLMRGVYWFSVYLACERMLHLYDHASRCVEFSVVHEGGAQGVCSLPRVWRDAVPKERVGLA